MSPRKERTEEALARLRRAAHDLARKKYGPGKSFTCDDCPVANVCRWVYDPYNLDGDCLATK